MHVPATTQSSPLARFHRVVGLVNLFLALLCIAVPAIGAQIGMSMALLLSLGLVMGTALMFFVARCIDRHPVGAYVTRRSSVGHRGTLRPSFA